MSHVLTVVSFFLLVLRDSVHSLYIPHYFYQLIFLFHLTFPFLIMFLSVEVNQRTQLTKIAEQTKIVSFSLQALIEVKLQKPCHFFFHLLIPLPSFIMSLDLGMFTLVFCYLVIYDFYQYFFPVIITINWQIFYVLVLFKWNGDVGFIIFCL